MKLHNDSVRWNARHVPIDSQGYDSDGAYWGLGERLYRISVRDKKTGEELSAKYVRLYRDDTRRVLALYGPDYCKQFGDLDDERAPHDRYTIRENTGARTSSRMYALFLAREHAEAIDAGEPCATPLKYHGFSGRTYHESEFASGAVAARTRALFARVPT